MPESNLSKQRTLAKEKLLHDDRAAAAHTGRQCPNCGHRLSGSEEICPHCGHALADYCTFCGADIPKGEQECPECGMNRAGVTCPFCGTVSARPYCRNCNEPLTPAARKELERALKDPEFIRAAQLAVKAAELKMSIAEDADPEQNEAPAAELPDDILRLKALLAGIKPETHEQKAPAEPEKQPAAAAGRKTREELRAEYEKVAAELDAALKSMLPPAGSTPAQQRNYFSARKLPKEIKLQKAVAWICNFCGFRHKHPSECCEPWRGGTWIYEESESIYVFD